MRTPNPRAVVPGTVLIAALVVAVVALTAANDGPSATSSGAGLTPTITLTRPVSAPTLTARERSDARRDQARERAGHGSDEPDQRRPDRAPVRTVDTSRGDGVLLAALPATTPDGWRLEVGRLDARTGLAYLTAAPTDGRPTTNRAAAAVVRRAARSVGDDPDRYRVSVPRSLLTTTEGTT